MSSVILAILAVTLLYVCYTDIRYRLIRNLTVLFILIVSIGVGYFVTGELNIIAPLCILVVGFLLSSFGFVGAGDVKLLVALTVSLSNSQVLELFLSMSLAGIPVALIAFIVHKIKRNSGRCEVPYGVAIVIGYGLTLLAFCAGYQVEPVTAVIVS